MERLRIEYGTGYMELNVEAFFPCKIPVMRKAARLINSYCTDEARAELLSQLRQLADGYTALCNGSRYFCFQRGRRQKYKGIFKNM